MLNFFSTSLVKALVARSCPVPCWAKTLRCAVPPILSSALDVGALVQAVTANNAAPLTATASARVSRRRRPVVLRVVDNIRSFLLWKGVA